MRVIASSQRDLKELSLRGEIRSDLYFRLAGLCFQIPPLRERLSDVPALVKQLARQTSGPPMELTPGAIEALKRHSWPGNVRELETVVRRLALTTDGRVQESHVAALLRQQGGSRAFPRWLFEGRSCEEVVDEVKRQCLLHLYEEHSGNLDRRAREMGMTRRNLHFRFWHVGLRMGELRSR